MTASPDDGASLGTGKFVSGLVDRWLVLVWGGRVLTGYHTLQGPRPVTRDQSHAHHHAPLGQQCVWTDSDANGSVLNTMYIGSLVKSERLKLLFLQS